MSCHYISIRVFGLSLEIGELPVGTVQKPQKVVYLGNGHIMAISQGGQLVSNRVTKNASYARFGKDSLSYLEGAAKLGALDKTQVAKLKKAIEKEAKADAIEMHAGFVLDSIDKLEELGVTMQVHENIERFFQKLAKVKK